MKKILVAVDGSPISTLVIAQAVRIAKASSARILLLRVVGLPVGLPEETLSRSPEDLAGLLEASARRELDALVEQIPVELRGGERVDLASPWQGICHAADLENADLIVIGAHGHSKLDLLLGTTATRVVNHANQSVMVVRPRVVVA